MEDYKKKYEEALEKARKLDEDGCHVLRDVFPELNESEDEKIRKALVRFHKSTIDIDGIKGEDILAWLKKQGEQKPVEPQQDIWLDSLKERYIWKPSDEQLDALYDVLNPSDGVDKKALESLYEQLKALV